MTFLKEIFKKFKQNDIKSKKSYSYLNQEDPMICWEVVGEIGDGAFGKVYKGKHKETSEVAALKQVELEEEGDLEEYIVEIEILTECKHQNIVNLYAAYNFDGKLWMALEFCNAGALDSLMVDLDKGLTESAIKYVSKEVLTGLIFLHEHRVIHRDMKAGNILITKDADVKLADFGVSAKMAANQQKRNTVQGTPYWMAPEVIHCQNMDSYYDCRADIWSFGITLIEMAQMRPPYHQMQPNRVLLKITKADPPTFDRPKLWSSDFNNFLKLCVTKTPEQRPYGSDLLKDNFIKSVTDEDKKSLRVLIFEAKAENIQETVEELDLLQRNSVMPNSDLDSVVQEIIETDDNSSMGSSDVVSMNYKPHSVSVKATDVPTSNKDGFKTEISQEILNDIINTQITLENDNCSIWGVVCDSMQDYNPRTNIDDVVQRLPVTRQDSMRAAMDDNVSENMSSIQTIGDTISEETDKDSEENGDRVVSSNQGENKVIDRKKSCYKTMTRTRKFVVDGEEMVTIDRRVVREGREHKNIEEINNRKEVLREMKILGKEESRQMRQIHFRIDSERNELESKLRKDELLLEQNYEMDIDKLAKDHKIQLDKIETTNINDLKKIQKKLLTEKTNKENEFKVKEKAKLDSEINKLSKNNRKENLKRMKEAHNAVFQENLRNFSEEINVNINDTIERQTKQNRKNIGDIEVRMLEDKYKRKRKFDEDVNKKLVSDCQALYQQEKQHNTDWYMLKRQQIKHRQDTEIALLINENKKEMDDLDSIQTAERKAIPRMIKTVSRTRFTQKKAEMMILFDKGQITSSDMKKRLKEFTDSEKERERKDQAKKELKLVKTREDLQNEHFQRLRENDQIHAEQKKDLTDQENASVKELEKKYKEKMKELDMAHEQRKEATDKKYKEELQDVRKFYQLYETPNGTITPYSATQSVASGSILAPKSTALVHQM